MIPEEVHKYGGSRREQPTCQNVQRCVRCLLKLDACNSHSSAVLNNPMQCLIADTLILLGVGGRAVGEEKAKEKKMMMI